jgi:CRP/FNR family transcriptional regulator, anaerobic regulatory protein
VSALACATCPVRDRAACAALLPDERENLAKLGHHRDVKRGETVFAAGDDMLACATLISGALKIASYDADGQQHILSLIHPAGFVGEMFSPIANHDVVAIADSRLCVFSKNQYAAAAEKFPALSQALLRRSAEDLYEARNILALTGRRSATQKVAGFVLAMARAASDSPCHPADRFDFLLTRGEMASLLGLTIETVSRQLGKLEKAGLIKKEGARGLSIRNAPALEAMAEGS